MDEHKTAKQIQADIKAAKDKIELGKTYQHYKNKQLYKPLYLATQEDNNELAVVYQQLYGDKLLFTRQVSAWCEEVSWEGKTVPRFKKVD